MWKSSNQFWFSNNQASVILLIYKSIASFHESIPISKLFLDLLQMEFCPPYDNFKIRSTKNLRFPIYFNQKSHSNSFHISLQIQFNQRFMFDYILVLIMLWPQHFIHYEKLKIGKIGIKKTKEDNMLVSQCFFKKTLSISVSSNCKRQSNNNIWYMSTTCSM